MAFCHNCGVKLPENAKFCQSCGTPVLQQPQAKPPQQTALQPGQAPYGILKLQCIYSVVAAHSVRRVRAAHDCMRQQAIITPDSRLTASLSAAQNGGKVAHTVRRCGGD